MFPFVHSPLQLLVASWMFKPNPRLRWIGINAPFPATAFLRKISGRDYGAGLPFPLIVRLGTNSFSMPCLFGLALNSLLLTMPIALFALMWFRLSAILSRLVLSPRLSGASLLQSL